MSAWGDRTDLLTFSRSNSSPLEHDLVRFVPVMFGCNAVLSLGLMSWFSGRLRECPGRAAVITGALVLI
jgi:hypothetical protein